MDDHTIGILGAGKLGITLAQLARAAGREVLVAGSGDAAKITLTVDTLAPGSRAATSAEVAAQADLVILALPLGKFRRVPVDALAGKLVIDAMNYWWEVDGPRRDILPDTQSSSEAVAELLADSHVVKAFNHMGYHDLHDETRPADTPGRKAIAVAGDRSEDVATVSRLIDQLGFDPLPIGDLASARILEPGHPAFGAAVDRTGLRKLVEGDQVRATIE